MNLYQPKLRWWEIKPKEEKRADKQPKNNKKKGLKNSPILAMP